jgi:hypothetical protein
MKYCATGSMYISSDRDGECEGLEGRRGRLIAEEEGEGPWPIQKITAQRVVAVTMVVQSLLPDMCRVDTIAIMTLVI